MWAAADPAAAAEQWRGIGSSPFAEMNSVFVFLLGFKEDLALLDRFWFLFRGLKQMEEDALRLMDGLGWRFFRGAGFKHRCGGQKLNIVWTQLLILRR